MQRYFFIAMFLFVLPVASQQVPDGPANEKAQKTYKEAFEYLHKGFMETAMDGFKKADKQDGGHCIACQRNLLTYAIKLHDWKAAEGAAAELAAEAQGPRDIALAHFNIGMIVFTKASEKSSDQLFPRVHDEMTKALSAYPRFPDAVFTDGRALAYMKQDDAAKLQFENFLKMVPATDPNRQRAARFLSNIDLARARLAPAFSVTTLDGQHISLDDLAGKVVLLDFWATWCGPCREALPHMQKVVKKFEGEPFVVLSISLMTTRRNGRSSSPRTA